MNISLTPELEDLVKDKVKTGMYQTASEVIREGLRLLKDRDERRNELRKDIRDGFDDIERGDYEEYTERQTKLLAEEIKSRGRRKLAALNKTTRAR